MSFITQKIYLLFIFPFIFFGILIDISSFVLNKIKFIYNKLNLKEGIMKGRIVMMLIYLFFSIGLLTAQDATVQGIVVSSEDNEPVVGASVLVVGTSLGVTTDIDGKFVIQNVPGTAKEIRVSYIGMQSQNMAISKGMMRIVLKIDAQVLDEVVVTAMGISRNKKALICGNLREGGRDCQFTHGEPHERLTRQSGRRGHFHGSRSGCDPECHYPRCLFVRKQPAALCGGRRTHHQ